MAIFSLAMRCAFYRKKTQKRKEDLKWVERRVSRNLLSGEAASESGRGGKAVGGGEEEPKVWISGVDGIAVITSELRHRCYSFHLRHTPTHSATRPCVPSSLPSSLVPLTFSFTKEKTKEVRK